MLQIAGIEHEMIETTSETFIRDWIRGLDADSLIYTDFVCFGGDGLFNQLINAVFSHPQKEKLALIPIGVMPCGSQNAVA